jgi:hypothetical protein
MPPAVHAVRGLWKRRASGGGVGWAAILALTLALEIDGGHRAGAAFDRSRREEYVALPWRSPLFDGMQRRDGKDAER